MAKIRRLKLTWQASDSDTVVSYKIYWSKDAELSYDSKGIDVGKVNEVVLPAEIVDRAVALASSAKVQGHRAELALVRAARAHAALLDRDSVTYADLDEVAGFALAHRIPGSTVASLEEVYRQLAESIPEKIRRAASNLDPGQDHDEVYLMGDQDFPGSAAAGSSLLTYLKKKLTTASSAPISTST